MHIAQVHYMPTVAVPHSANYSDHKVPRHTTLMSSNQPAALLDDSKAPAEDVPSPSKRLKTDEINQNMDNVMHQCDCLYIEALQSGIEIISIEETATQDGFFNSLRKAVGMKEPIKAKLGLLRFVTRTTGGTAYDRALNQRASASDNRQHPRQHLLRIPPDGKSTPSSRKKALDEIAKYLNHNDDREPIKNTVSHTVWKKRKSDGISKYTVPPNCDRTPATGDLAKMGNRVVPNHVTEYIRCAYSCVNNSWYTQNLQLAHMFFDMPYPKEACNTLGYPKNP